MLQRFEFTKVCMGENIKRHFSRNFDIFFNMNDLRQCLGVFSIVLSLFTKRDPKPFKHVIAF